MANMYPGPLNVRVPTFDEQAKLIVNYSRNIDDYPINHLYTLSLTDALVGKYLELTPEQQGAVNDTSSASSEWVDGAEMPIMLEDGQQFDYKEFALRRYFRSFPIGYITEQQAPWALIESQSNVLANKLMTMRAKRFYTLLQDSSNYYAGNTATATAAGGGVWSAATSANRYIQKSLRHGATTIIKATMNGVKVSDLVLVVGPTVAGKMAESGEIADYVAQSTDAALYLEGKLFKDQFSKYGLPGKIYGYTVVVDDTVVEGRTNIGAASDKSFLAGDTSAYFIARPGSLTGQAGGSSFSFLHNFVWKQGEFQVKIKDDPFNERKVLTVQEFSQLKVVASRAGFVFTSVVS